MQAAVAVLGTEDKATVEVMGNGFALMVGKALVPVAVVDMTATILYPLPHRHRSPITSIFKHPTSSTKLPLSIPSPQARKLLRLAHSIVSRW